MGATTSAGEAPKNKGQGDDPWEETQQEKKANENKVNESNLIYDEKEGKYYDPLSGESVVAPGKYEPEPAKRPIRVKVRKRQNYTLRKRRKPPKPIPIPQSPDPPTPPKPLRPPTQYDTDGYAIYYDEYGTRIDYDQDGYLVVPEPYYDNNGEVVEPTFDEYGNLIVYDAYGIPVDNDQNGDPVEYDRYGYPVEYDEQGNPKERTYYPKYDEYGNEIPQKKKKEPQFEHPDDGYDYDDSIYTYTTLDSPILPTPSPASSDDVQEKDDSGDELSMEDVTEFTWHPHQVVMPRDEARALIKTGGEDCSCYPKRSNSMIPSMVYDQVMCPHTNNVIGQAHTAVNYRFDDNWNERYTKVHRPKRHERVRSKITSVWGYPYRQFPDYKPGDEMFKGGLRGEFQKPTSRPQLASQSADNKKESATGSQRTQIKSKAESELNQEDGKSNNETLNRKKGKENKYAGKKEEKDGKTKEVKKEDADKTNNNLSKSENRKPNQNGTADKEKGGDVKTDEAVVKSPDKNTLPRSKENVKQSVEKDERKTSESAKQMDAKDKKLKHLSREQISQPKIHKAKEDVSAKGKKRENVGNHSRASVVAKSFLPKIGYTPDHPFSNAKQRSPSPGKETRKEHENLSLPPIPASPAFSIVSSVTATSQELYHQPDITTSRRFEGKYYDPVTKKTYTYEIKPRFDKHVQDWDALRQV